MPVKKKTTTKKVIKKTTKVKTKKKVEVKKNPPADAKQWEGIENKFENHFSEKGAD